MGESARYLASSPYIRNLATLVIAYGMSINLVEVTWKAKLKAAFPNPTDYSAFMGSFSSAVGRGGAPTRSQKSRRADARAVRCAPDLRLPPRRVPGQTGVVTLFMMLFGRFVFRKWGWGPAAMITPAVLLATGVAFFALCLTGSTFAAPLAALGTTPLMLAVFVGAAQNIMSKAAKCAARHPSPPSDPRPRAPSNHRLPRSRHAPSQARPTSSCKQEAAGQTSSSAPP